MREATPNILCEDRFCTTLARPKNASFRQGIQRYARAAGVETLLV
jgi:hypothetical protein